MGETSKCNDFGKCQISYAAPIRVCSEFRSESIPRKCC